MNENMSLVVGQCTNCGGNVTPDHRCGPPEGFGKDDVFSEILKRMDAERAAVVQIATMLGMADGWTPEQVVERLELMNTKYAQLKVLFEKQYEDCLIGCRWFEKEFGPSFNGRDLAVKVQMAEPLMAELRTSQKLATSQAEEIARLRAALEEISLLADFKRIPEYQVGRNYRWALDRARKELSALAPVPASQADAGEAEA